MQRLIYVLVYPFLWIISVLPFPVFYLFSDLVSFFLFRVINYRKKTVTKNITLAFPEKSSEEIKKIRREFYRHFCDIFLEMVKTLTISDKELKKRFIYKNPEELHRLESLQKSYIIMIGHYASYEWVIALHFFGLTYQGYGIYKPIKNKYFDRLIKKIRGRFSTTMLSAKIVPKKIAQNKKKGVLASYGMIADQSPKLSNARYWRNFMGVKVPVFVGSEIIAKRLDLAVTYLHIEKVKRGHYEATFIPLADKPQNFADFEITDRYFELLEEQIKTQPAYYLWTHKRWKHAGKSKISEHKK